MRDVSFGFVVLVLGSVVMSRIVVTAFCFAVRRSNASSTTMTGSKAGSTAIAYSGDCRTSTAFNAWTFHSSALANSKFTCGTRWWSWFWNSWLGRWTSSNHRMDFFDHRTNLHKKTTNNKEKKHEKQ